MNKKIIIYKSKILNLNKKMMKKSAPKYVTQRQLLPKNFKTIVSKNNI